MLKSLLFIYIFHIQFVVVVGTDLSEADAAFLATLYQRFRYDFLRVLPHPGAKQFSVIVFNGAGRNTSAQALRPCPYVFIDEQLHQEPDDQAYRATNYLAATVKDMENAAQSRLHAEESVIIAARGWIKVNHIPATIHLFTFYSPCLQCARFIQKLANILPNTVIHVGYAENDPGASHPEIFRSLSTLSFISNVRIGQVNVESEQPRDELRIAQSDTCSTHYVKQGSCLVQSNPYDVHCMRPMEDSREDSYSKTTTGKRKLSYCGHSSTKLPRLTCSHHGADYFDEVKQQLCIIDPQATPSSTSDPGQEELSSNSDESDSEVHNHYMYMNDNEGGVSEQQFDGEQDGEQDLEESEMCYTRTTLNDEKSSHLDNNNISEPLTFTSSIQEQSSVDSNQDTDQEELSSNSDESDSEVHNHHHEGGVSEQQFDGEQDLEKKESEDEEDMLTWSHYQFFKFILSVLYLNNFKR